MDMYYIGDNSNEFGFKYGSKYRVFPAERNDIELDYIGIEVYGYNVGSEPIAEYFLDFADFIDSFTPYEFEFGVIDEDIPKKPYEDNGNMVCPVCMEVVTDDFSHCVNCGQTLDWD